MSKEDINNALLQLNSEYFSVINSREYNIGRRILKYVDIIRKFNFVALKKRLDDEKIMRRSYRCGRIKKESHFYAEGSKPEDNIRGVVYSCITEGYDKVHLPYYCPDNCDFILFSDANNSLKNNNVWDIRDVPISNQTSNITNYINRYCKLNPFHLFEEYDFAVYIDGNVKIVGDISFLYSIAKKSKIGIAMHEHPIRECLYSEGNACIVRHKGNVQKIKDQLDRYHQIGFPEKFGLFEATIIVTDLHNPIAKEIFSCWWQEYLKSESLRDQISFPYVLWKNGFNKDDVGNLGSDKGKNPMFRIEAHEIK